MPALLLCDEKASSEWCKSAEMKIDIIYLNRFAMEKNVGIS